MPSGLTQRQLQTQQTQFLHNTDSATKRIGLPTLAKPENLCRGVPFHPHSPVLMLTTDTSQIDYGAHLGEHKAQGCWSLSEMRLHINLLELRDIRQGGARSHSLCTEAIKLWNWCVQHHIKVTTSYLPACHNTTVYTLSRHFSEEHEWELHPTIF